VDVSHAREHYWQCAQLAFTANTKRLWEWTDRRKEELDSGNVEAVNKALKNVPVTTEEAPECVKQAYGILSKIKSECITSAFARVGILLVLVLKQDVEQLWGKRLKQSGMHWTVNGANSITDLRCTLLIHRWEYLCRTPSLLIF